MRNGFPTTITIVQNDHGYDLAFQLQDSNAVAIDVSNSSVFFKGQLQSDYPQQFQNSMQIVDAVNGKVKYNVLATDFVIAGIWSAQIAVQYNSGEVITWSDISITVEPELPFS